MKGEIVVDHHRAEGAIHAAPLQVSGTASGYPHEFKNFNENNPRASTQAGNFKWPNKKCNNLAPEHKLLKFPVPPNEVGPFYDPTAPQAQDDAWSYAAQAMRAIYIRTSACDWP